MPKGIFVDYIGHNLNVRGWRDSHNNSWALANSTRFGTRTHHRFKHKLHDAVPRHAALLALKGRIYVRRIARATRRAHRAERSGAATVRLLRWLRRVNAFHSASNSIKRFRAFEIASAFFYRTRAHGCSHACGCSGALRAFGSMTCL